MIDNYKVSELTDKLSEAFGNVKEEKISILNLASYCENINGDCNKCLHKTECDKLRPLISEYEFGNEKESVKEVLKRWI